MADVAEVFYETDTLQKDGSRGKQFWRGEAVELDNGDFGHRTESWSKKKDGTDSKHRVSKVTTTEAKNVGKANERSPKEQAVSEINSKADKKKDKRYWPLGEEKPDFKEMPMSAKKYGKIEGGEFVSKRGPGKIDFPVYVQPKLDGIRMMFDGETGWSRKLKEFDEDVIEPFTKMDVPGNVRLDGELMLPPGKYSFQQTVSAVKRYQKHLSPKLVFYVFDAYVTDKPQMPFSGRIQKVSSAVANAQMRKLGVNVEMVSTTKAKTHEEVLQLHGEYTADGLEGTMVRAAQGTYKDSTTRSGDLLKLKGFTDEEFTITGVREGKGKFEGMAVLICKSENGTFEVTPKGTEADRQRMFEDREQIVGKELTVRFQNLTDEGLPRFPVGIAIRDYE